MDVGGWSGVGWCRCRSSALLNYICRRAFSPSHCSHFLRATRSLPHSWYLLLTFLMSNECYSLKTHWKVKVKTLDTLNIAEEAASNGTKAHVNLNKRLPKAMMLKIINNLNHGNNGIYLNSFLFCVYFYIFFLFCHHLLRLIIFAVVVECRVSRDCDELTCMRRLYIKPFSLSVCEISPLFATNFRSKTFAIYQIAAKLD